MNATWFGLILSFTCPQDAGPYLPRPLLEELEKRPRQDRSSEYSAAWLRQRRPDLLDASRLGMLAGVLRDSNGKPISGAVLGAISPEPGSEAPASTEPGHPSAGWDSRSESQEDCLAFSDELGRFEY